MRAVPTATLPCVSKRAAVAHNAAACCAERPWARGMLTRRALLPCGGHRRRQRWWQRKPARARAAEAERAECGGAASVRAPRAAPAAAAADGGSCGSFGSRIERGRLRRRRRRGGTCSRRPSSCGSRRPSNSGSRRPSSGSSGSYRFVACPRSPREHAGLMRQAFSRAHAACGAARAAASPLQVATAVSFSGAAGCRCFSSFPAGAAAGSGPAFAAWAKAEAPPPPRSPPASGAPPGGA